MDRRTRPALAGLGQERILPRPEAQRIVRQNARPRYGRPRAGGFPGDRSSVHRRHSVGAFGDFTKG